MSIGGPAYLLGALRERIATREDQIINYLVQHLDGGVLEDSTMYTMVARISELRGLIRDLEREARHEMGRPGESI